MTNAQQEHLIFEAFLQTIRSGNFTPSQMEDIVYAIHAAYVDHNEAIDNQLPMTLESFADMMVTARKNTEPMDDDGFDENAPRRITGGYVHTVASL